MPVLHWEGSLVPPKKKIPLQLLKMSRILKEEKIPFELLKVFLISKE
jgi:hypothetical protein